CAAGPLSSSACSCGPAPGSSPPATTTPSRWPPTTGTSSTSSGWACSAPSTCSDDGARDQERRPKVIIASRLFMAMGLFGLVAGAIYYLANPHAELAGVGLLGAFFAACLYIGIMLWTASPANRRTPRPPGLGCGGLSSPPACTSASCSGRPARPTGAASPSPTPGCPARPIPS